MRPRIEIVREIDRLLDQHCRPCNGRPTDPDTYRVCQTYCTQECPVGLKLKALGAELDEDMKQTRARRKTG